jgi:hypothetical protein
MIRVWDSKVLKQRERDAREEALAAQSDDDWKFAVLQLERGKSNLEYGFVDCPLPACRRAKRCAGNPLVCTARGELQPGAEQDVVEEFYADIQEERRNAAAEGWPPDVERVLYYVQEDDEELDVRPPAPRDEPGRNMETVKDAVRRDVAPAPPEPQPPLRQPVSPLSPRAEPATSAAVTPAPPVAGAPRLVATPAVPAPAPPPAEPVSSPEVEERVNRIWADYVAGKPIPRPEPRIRSLSDDRPWSVPPWWRGPR